MKRGLTLNLRQDLRKTNETLAGLNRELAAKMITLAAQTGDVQPLIEAVQSLSKANDLYTQATTPLSHAQIQKALGDTLFKMARAEDHREALDHAIIAYRGAITLASMLGETKLRNAAKKNCALAMNLRGDRPQERSAFSAA